MKRLSFAYLLAGFACLVMAGGARAEDKAEQLKRDAARLGQIKRIALAPVVVQLRFDQGNRLPDPNRLAARCAAAMRLPMILEEKMKTGRYALLPSEMVTLALKETNSQPTDLYVAQAKGSWENPCETVRNNKGDEASLLNVRAEMKKTPDAMTLFRFRWHDLPDTCIGLASFGAGVPAPIDAERAKALAAKVGADAMLYCQVTEMETHIGSALFGGFKSTRLHLHFTLVAADDGAVVWQARARGVKSQKAGFFTGLGAFKGEDRKAIEAAVQATEILLDDLYNGTGAPVGAPVSK